MSLIHEERSSDSPFIDTVMRGWTVGDGSAIRPAEVHWHLVFTKHKGRTYPIFVGPWTAAGVAAWAEGAELLWIQFKLGAFMPHLPARDFRDVETILPRAGRQSFWLNGSAWQFPDYDNVETFVERLAHEEVLVRDSLVSDVLQGHLQEMSPRTLRQRFLRATGLPQSHIRQFERAKQAEALLRQGVPILDAVYETGYYDQPHLTRSLKQFIGYTPAQILPALEP